MINRFDEASVSSLETLVFFAFYPLVKKRKSL
jgi:hypothetical protein